MNTFEPTFESVLVNMVIAVIMMDALLSFGTMFRTGLLSKIVNWWLDRK